MNNDEILLIETLNLLFSPNIIPKLQLMSDLDLYIFKSIVYEIDPYLSTIKNSNEGLSDFEVVLFFLESKSSQLLPNIDFKEILFKNHEYSKEYTHGEVILVLTALSTKKDQFFDKITTYDEEERLMNFFVNTIMKFIDLDEDPKNVQSNLDEEERIEAMIQLRTNERIREYEQIHQNYIQTAEREINELRDKLINYERQNFDYELKYKDSLKEIENLKSSQQNIEIINSKIQINEEHSQETKNDFDEIMQNYENVIKSYVLELEKSRNEKESLSLKLKELDVLKQENAKLNDLVLDYNHMKERTKDFDNMVNELEIKNSKINSFAKENKNFISTLEKVMKDLSTTSEKLRQVEFEKKQLEYDIIDLQNTVSRLENKLKSTNEANLKTKEDSPKKHTYQSYATNENIEIRFSAAQNSSRNKFSVDEYIQNEQQGDSFNNKIETNDRLEILKTCKEQYDKINSLFELNQNLTLENDRLKNDLTQLENKINDSLLNDKDKLKINSKEYTDLQNMKNDFESLKSENLILKEKHQIIVENKMILEKEIFSLKQQISSKSKILNEIEEENRKLNKKIKDLIIEQEKLKSGNKERPTLTNFNKITPNPGNGITNAISPSTRAKISNLFSKGSNPNDKPILLEGKKNNFDEICNLKNEILKLKMENLEDRNLRQENLKLKQELGYVKEKSLEYEESLKLKENKIAFLENDISVLNEKIATISNEQNSYKLSLENLKYSVGEEHELISEQLHELAKKFVALKNELVE